MLITCEQLLYYSYLTHIYKHVIYNTATHIPILAVDKNFRLYYSTFYLRDVPRGCSFRRRDEKQGSVSVLRARHGAHHGAHGLGRYDLVPDMGFNPRVQWAVRQDRDRDGCRRGPIRQPHVQLQPDLRHDDYDV